MKVLLIKSDKVARAAIAFLMESELGVKVTEAASIQDGLACLLDDSVKFDILVCDDEEGNQKIFKYLMTGDMQIRCVVLKDPKAPSVLAFPDLIVAHVNPGKIAEELKAAFAERLNGVKQETVAGDDEKYCRIRALTVMRKSPLLSDVFIRLSALKYVRVFKKGDKFTEKEIVAFLEKRQIDYLFLLKADSVALAAKLKEDMEREFHEAAAKPEEATNSAIAAQEAVMELGSKIGFTPDVQALAKQGMLTTLKAISSGKPQLAKIFQGILANKGNYTGSHAVLTAQVACGLAVGLDWVSESTFQKLTFASFFHDMFLANNQLVQVKSMEELQRRKAEFTEVEFKAYVVHTLAAAETIRTFSEVPPDVDTIIAQHHEKPDGSGFPRHLTAGKIAPLSALFIVAHDIVDHIFEHGTEKIEEFFVDYKKKYSIGHFKKILDHMDLAKAGLNEPKFAVEAVL